MSKEFPTVTLTIPLEQARALQMCAEVGGEDPPEELVDLARDAMDALDRAIQRTMLDLEGGSAAPVDGPSLEVVGCTCAGEGARNLGCRIHGDNA